jgi:hypothetical protein
MRCKRCKAKFESKVFLMKFCDKDECIQEMVKQAKDKAWKKEKPKRKADLMTLPDWLKIAQTHFNHYVRLRDKANNFTSCISCGNDLREGNTDAGHFYSAGGHANLRFNEDNCHSQCSRPCNKDKAGDIHKYRIGLIERIGIERVNELEKIAFDTRKFTIEEVKNIAETYKQKIKELK